MNKEQIAYDSAKILLDIGAVQVNADVPFVYTSGKVGPVYVDCRRPISFPDARKALMDYAAQMLGALDIDYVAGGETAGIPYAAFVSDRLNKPMLYIRKKPKGFGRMAQIEGYIEGDHAKVAIIEDVQNFGTSVKIFVDALRGANITVENLFVIFQYGHASSLAAMREMGITLHALTSWKDVLTVARKEGYFDEATAQSVEAFLADPDAWNEANAHKAKKA